MDNTDTKLMTASEVAHVFRVTTRTLSKWVDDGTFPKPIRLGGTLRWKAEVVDQTMKQATA